MADAVSIASLVIFLIFLQPSLFCLWKHGWSGFLGWFYVQLFCLVRIVGSGIKIHEEANNDTNSKTSLIVNSIGLSPLILAAAGILHEAYSARNPGCDRKRKILEVFLIIQYHVFVSIALLTIVIGIVKVFDNDQGDAKSVLLTVGSAIVIIAWLLLILWATVQLLGHFKAAGRSADRAAARGTKLLQAVGIVLPLLGLRLVYAVSFLMLELHHPRAEYLRSLAVRICLSVVPEMVTILVFVLVGLWTRDIQAAKKSKMQDYHRPARV